MTFLPVSIHSKTYKRMGKITQLTSCQLPKLISGLQAYKPLSTKMIGHATFNKTLEEPMNHFFVDKWPQFSTIISTSPRGQKNIPIHISRCVNIFSVKNDQDVVKNMILQNKNIDWNTPVEFPGYEEELNPAIEEVCSSKGGTLTEIDDYIYDCLTTEKKDLIITPIPDGYRVEPLKESEAEEANSLWTYRDEHSLDYIKFLVKTQGSYGVWSEDGGLAGFVTISEHGQCGMLYVSPEHRGKALGAVLFSRMIDQSLDMKGICFAYAHINNAASRILQLNIGSKLIGKRFLYRYYTP